MPKILVIDNKNDSLIEMKAILNDAFPDAAVYTALSPQAQAEEAKQRAAAVLSAATVQTARYVTTVDAHCATSKQCLRYLLGCTG